MVERMFGHYQRTFNMVANKLPAPFASISLIPDPKGIVHLANDTPFVCSTIQTVARSMRYIVRPLDHERAWTIAMDKDFRIMEAREVSRGDHNRVQFTIADMFTSAEQIGAEYVVALHNHPNNDPVPSLQDVRTTINMMAFDRDGVNGFEVKRRFNVRFLEHLVLTPSGKFTAIIADNWCTEQKIAMLEMEQLFGIPLFADRYM